MHVREQRDKLFLHEIHHGQEEGMFVSQSAAVAALLHLCHCYASANMRMHAFVNVCVCGGEGDKTVLHQNVSSKTLLCLSHMRNRHTES